MKYTHEQQEEALMNACSNCGLGRSLEYIKYKNELRTWADKIMGGWFRKLMPCKKSYLYCTSLDINFFYNQDGKACFSYSGYSDSEYECNCLKFALEVSTIMLNEMNKQIQLFDV